MKKSFILVACFLAIFLLGLVFFCVPKHIQTTTWACDASGNTKKVEIDVQLYRRLFIGPYVKGSVFLDGVEYIDEDTLYKKHLTFDKSRRASKNDNMVFCKKPESIILGDRIAIFEALAQNRIIFLYFDTKNTYEKFVFAYMDESMMVDGSIRGLIYCAPAETADEAHQIASSFRISID